MAKAGKLNYACNSHDMDVAELQLPQTMHMHKSIVPKRLRIYSCHMLENTATKLS